MTPDLPYRAWIRTQPCIICGRDAEPCHVRSRGAGGTDLGNIVPMCRIHHTEQHKIGIKTFQAKWKVDMVALALQYAQNAPDCPRTP